MVIINISFPPPWAPFPIQHGRDLQLALVRAWFVFDGTQARAGGGIEDTASRLWVNQGLCPLSFVDRSGGGWRRWTTARVSMVGVAVGSRSK